MRPNLAPLLVALVLWTAPALAADDPAKDALLGTLSPAPVAWRVPPVKAPTMPESKPPLIHSVASERLIASFRAQLLSAPDGKARKDLLAVLDTLEEGAAKAPDKERQSWIDGHLGELNVAVRTLPAGTPDEVIKIAARQAAR